MSERDLIVSQGRELIGQLEKDGVGEILKPLSSEIHLFDTFAAGTALLKDRAPLAALKIGDKLILRREESKFDRNAVLILNEKNERIGFIPEKDNVVFARLMDAGKMLIAKVANLDRKGSFSQITIGIYLVDF